MSTTSEGRALRDAAAVEPRGDDLFDVTLSPHYTVLEHPNGGYLQCVLANAALAAASDAGSRHLHVTALTTNFIHAANVGPATVRASVRRVGKGVSFVHVTLRQGELVMAESVVTLGTLRDDVALRYVDAVAPVVAPRETCALASPPADVRHITDVVELRLDPRGLGWREGIHHDRAELLGWLRLNDGHAAWDAWNVLFAADVMPPATLPLGSSGWVPTLQLTTYVRAHPVGEWLIARQWCQIVSDGTVDERCDLFDEEGTLVATSSQLAMVRFPQTEKE